MRPLRNLVLVAPKKMKDKSEGGIIFPETVKKKHQARQGQIVTFGDDVDEDLKAGEKVLFGKYEGFDIEFEGEDYILIEDNKLVAKLEE
jgi:chaperonin GroES